MKRIFLTFFLIFTPFLRALHEPITTNHFHQFFWANYSHFSGQTEIAQKWFQSLSNDNPSPHFLMGYVPFLFDSNKHHEIVSLLPLLDTSFSHNHEIQQLVAQSLAKTGNQQESDERFIKLSNQFKHDQAIAFQTAQVYIRRKEPENAIATIDNLLNGSPKKPNNFIFYFLKAQIYTQLNNLEKSLENVQACLHMQPHFDKGWLLLALLQEQAGRLDEAIKGFTAFLETSQDKHHDIEQHLTQLVFKQKLALQQSQANLPSSDSARALYFFEKKDYAQSLAYCEKELEKNPKDTENRLLKIQILSAMNNQTQAAEQLKTWILQSPDEQIWFDTLHLLCSSGLTIQKAIAVLEDIAKALPNNLMTLLCLADLSTRIQHHDTALTYHTKALALTPDPHLKTKIMYQMGLLYHAQQKFDAMENILEQGLALAQNFPPLLNLLAYHYAKNDKKLEIAQQLITRALDSNAHKAYYLETQALIHYKQHDYEQALTLLTSITKEIPADFAILSTLGKTYYKLGKKNEAIGTLQDALKIASHDYQKKQCAQLLEQWNHS